MTNLLIKSKHFSSSFNSNNKPYFYSLLVIIALALTLRLLGLDKGIWLDEEFSIRMISQNSITQMLEDLRHDTFPPLYYICLYYWQQISHQEEFLKVLSIFFDLGTLIVIIQWLKQYSRLASILAGLFWATTPMMLRYAQEIRSYSLLIFATALAFFFASRIALASEKRCGYIGLLVSLIIAVSSQLVGIMLFLPICLFILLMTKNRNIIQWGKVITALIIPTVIFFLFYQFYLIKLPDETGYWWMPSVSLELIDSTINYILGFSSLSLPNYSYNINNFIIWGFFGILVAFGAWQRHYPFLAAVILYWLEIIIYSMVRLPIFWYRTILPSLVPLIAFMTLQLATIQKKNIKVLCIIVFITFSITFTINWITNQAWKPVEPLKVVAQLVESKWQKNDLAILYPAYIKDSVKHYFTDLPVLATIGVNPWDDVDKTKLEFDKHTSPSDIFLVMRADLSLPKNFSKYSQFLDLIKSKFFQKSNLNVYLIISHDLGIVRELDKVTKMLAILKSKFGNPKLYQKFESYVISKYGLS
jgi:uncharacterized membrane protein